jgi:hypothetical protein
MYFVSKNIRCKPEKIDRWAAAMDALRTDLLRMARDDS